MNIIFITKKKIIPSGACVIYVTVFLLVLFSLGGRNPLHHSENKPVLGLLPALHHKVCSIIWRMWTKWKYFHCFQFNQDICKEWMSFYEDTLFRNPEKFIFYQWLFFTVSFFIIWMMLYLKSVNIVVIAFSTPLRTVVNITSF